MTFKQVRPNHNLFDICERKRYDVDRQKKKVSLRSLEDQIKYQTKPKNFHKRLKYKMSKGQYALIAEIKKASPSAGLIRERFTPYSHAYQYTKGGAACLSVLTDIPYFQGSPYDLAQARRATYLPILRKDFMVDPYQIFESRAMGADCVLLIMAVLEDSLAAEMETIAHDLGMDVLIETHDLGELERALRLKSTLVGINNRNLKTMKTDIATSAELVGHFPKGYTIVSESGLKTPQDLAQMSEIGINTFLIGESLMKQTDVTQATKDLLDRSAL